MITEIKAIVAKANYKVEDKYVFGHTHWNTIKEIPEAKYPAFVVDTFKKSYVQETEGSESNLTSTNVTFFILFKNNASFDEDDAEQILNDVLELFGTWTEYQIFQMNSCEISNLEIGGIPVIGFYCDITFIKAAVLYD